MKWNGRQYRPANAQFITKKKPFDFQEALKPYGEKELPAWNTIVAVNNEVSQPVPDVTPTPTGTAAVTPTPTNTPTNTETPTPTPSATPSPQTVLWVANSGFEDGYSIDGVNWSPIQSNYQPTVDSQWQGLATNGSRWSAVGTYFPGFLPLTYYSDNGYYWYSGNNSYTSFLSSSPSELASNGSMFVIGGASTYATILSGGSFTTVGYSYDGITYSAGNISYASGSIARNSGITSFAYNGNMWLAGGTSTGTTANQTKLIYSYDGINWTGQTNVIFTGTSVTGLAYGNGIWVGVQSLNTNNAKICASTDGFNWTASTNATNTTLFGTTTSPSQVYFFDNKFIATTTAASGATNHLICYSTDGLTWSAATDTKTLMPLGPNHCSSNKTNLMICGGRVLSPNNISLYRSTNGINWSANTNTDYRTTFTGATFANISSNVPMLPPPNPTPTPTQTQTQTPTNTGTPTGTPQSTSTPTPTITPSPTQLPFLLNSYTGATSGYSFRKLNSSYSGNVIRVRRSSDNAEQNIGFNGNVIDVSALTTFVGANNGFIVTWYDQSGNGYNMNNSTAVQQPMIVSGGTVLSDSKGYYALFDGSNDNLSGGIISVDGLFTVGNVSYSTYFVGLATGTEQTYISQGGASTNTSLGIQTQVTTGNAVHYWYGNDLTSANDLRNLNIIAGLTYVVGGTRTTSINGFSNTTDTPGAHNMSQSGRPTYIGRAGFSPQYYLNGRFREFVVYNINKSADTSAIKSNMNSYYGIY